MLLLGFGTEVVVVVLLNPCKRGEIGDVTVGVTCGCELNKFNGDASGVVAFFAGVPNMALNRSSSAAGELIVGVDGLLIISGLGDPTVCLLKNE